MSARNHFRLSYLVQRATDKPTIRRQFKVRLTPLEELEAALSCLEWLATLRPELYKCQRGLFYAERLRGRLMWLV
jgi:hypothetical protein